MQERLLKLIGHKSRHAFAKSIGVSPTLLANALKRGDPPKFPIFPASALIHRVSLDWLWLGRGEPYYVYRATTDKQLAGMLEPEIYKSHALVSGDSVLLIGHRKSVHNDVEYREIRVYDGPIGEHTITKLRPYTTHASEVSLRILEGVRSGESSNDIFMNLIEETTYNVIVLDSLMPELMLDKLEIMDALKGLDKTQRDTIKSVAMSYKKKA